MAKTVEVPLSLLKSFARAAEAFERLEDELEDYLISRDDKLLERLRNARTEHAHGDTITLQELKQRVVHG